MQLVIDNLRQNSPGTFACARDVAYLNRLLPELKILCVFRRFRDYQGRKFYASFPEHPDAFFSLEKDCFAINHYHTKTYSENINLDPAFSTDIIP